MVLCVISPPQTQVLARERHSPTEPPLFSPGSPPAVAAAIGFFHEVLCLELAVLVSPASQPRLAQLSSPLHVICH